MENPLSRLWNWAQKEIKSMRPQSLEEKIEAKINRITELKSHRSYPSDDNILAKIRKEEESLKTLVPKLQKKYDTLTSGFSREASKFQTAQDDQFNFGIMSYITQKMDALAVEAVNYCKNSDLRTEEFERKYTPQDDGQWISQHKIDSQQVLQIIKEVDSADKLVKSKLNKGKQQAEAAYTKLETISKKLNRIKQINDLIKPMGAGSSNILLGTQVHVQDVKLPTRDPSLQETAEKLIRHTGQETDITKLATFLESQMKRSARVPVYELTKFENLADKCKQSKIHQYMTRVKNLQSTEAQATEVTTVMDPEKHKETKTKAKKIIKAYNKKFTPQDIQASMASAATFVKEVRAEERSRRSSAREKLTQLEILAATCEQSRKPKNMTMAKGQASIVAVAATPVSPEAQARRHALDNHAAVSRPSPQTGGVASKKRSGGRGGRG